MIELQYSISEPAELARFRRRNPGAAWGNPDFETVRPIIRHQLNREQESLCVYCECALGSDDGRVEHIKSRAANPALTFVYDNLAHSCSEPNHCGRRRGSLDLPVEPRPRCNRFFTLMALDGRLAPASGLANLEVQQATDTINVLGLNDPALKFKDIRSAS